MFALAYLAPKKKGTGTAICLPQFFKTREEAYQALGSLELEHADVIDLERC